MAFRAILFDQGNTLLEYSLQGHWPEFRRQRLAEMFPLVCDSSKGPNLTSTEFVEKVGEIIGKRGNEIEKNGLSWHFAKRLASRETTNTKKGGVNKCLETLDKMDFAG